jgi:hypothetical protein
MSIGLLFWVLMVLWFFSYAGTKWGGLGGPYLYMNDLLTWVLFFLVGWKLFGFVIHQ